MNRRVMIPSLLLMLVAGTALAQQPPPPTTANPQGSTQPAKPGDPGEGLKPPVLLQKVEAVYPKRALDERVEAKIVLALDIDPSGAVENVELVRSSTTAGFLPAGTRSSTITAERYGFIDAARAAAYQLTFEPAVENGEPVGVRITYTFNFKLPPLPAVATTPTGTSTAPKAPRIANFVGVVLERGTRAKVPGAVVTVFQGEGESAKGFEATTDAEGSFELFDLTPGEWSVIAELDGYYPFRTKETIEAGVATEVTYYVEKRSGNPLDVLVEAPRPKKEVVRRTLTISEIVKVPGTLGDPILVVENLPGVARSAGGGNIVVRGSGPEDTDVYIDGVNVPLIYHFGALRSVIPAEMIETVDFYPGNFSTYYGRATGGVFDAHLKKLDAERLRGVVDVSLLDASLFVEAPIGETFWVAAAGRRSYIDAILSAVVPESAPISLTSAPRYYDYQLLTRWRPTSDHDLRVSLIGSDDTLELLFENPGDIDAQIQARSLSAATRFYRGIAEWSWTIAPGWTNELMFAVGRDVIDTSLGDQFKFGLNIYRNQAREAVTWAAAEGISITGGLDYEFTQTDAEFRTPGLPPKEGDATQGTDDLTEIIVANLEDIRYVTVAPYLEAELTFGDLTLVPGLRVDYFNQVQDWSFEPRIVGRYRFDDAWVAKAGVGVVHQEPAPDETSAQFGNPLLGLEKALQYSAGAEWKPLPFLLIDATLFYKDMMGLVSRTALARSENGETIPLIYDNGGTGRVYGLELYVKHDLSNNLSGWLTYTLSRAERTDSGVEGSRLFDFDQTHILTVIASYRFPENWELGIRWRLVSGNPYTPFVRGVYNVDGDRYEAVPAATNSDRLPIFHQLDVRLDKRWIFDSWIFSSYLSLTNAYNRPNVEGFSYNYDFSQSSEQTGLPIYPILGIRAEL
jgi:outer membrane receptor protein involved in Fe transport